MVKLLKKELAPQDRCTSLSDSDSDVESIYTNEEGIPPSSQPNQNAGQSSAIPHVIALFPPCTPPPPDAFSPGRRFAPAQNPHPVQLPPTWILEDDEKPRTAEYDPDSPVHLL